MALADKLASRGLPRTKSGMDAWYQALPGSDKAAVDDAIANRAWEAEELMSIFESEGAPVPSVTTFRAWRREHVAR